MCALGNELKNAFSQGILKASSTRDGYFYQVSAVIDEAFRNTDENDTVSVCEARSALIGALGRVFSDPNRLDEARRTVEGVVGQHLGRLYELRRQGSSSSSVIPRSNIRGLFFGRVRAGVISD